MPTYNQVISVAKQKTYSTEALALPIMAAANSLVQFAPVLEPGRTPGDLTASAEYVIQVAERNRAQNITYTKAGGTSQDLAALDTFKTPTWVSKGVGTGTLRGIGTKVGINTKYNSDNLGAIQAKVIADQVKVEAIERHEQLVELAITDATLGAPIAAPAAGTTPIRDAIVEDALKIQMLSDNIKHGTSKDQIVVLIHPVLSAFVEKEIGNSFNNERPIYNTGLKSRFSVAGYPVIEVMDLNKFAASDALNRNGFIVMDAEALAFKKDNTKLPVDIDHVLHRYIGEYFYTIQTSILKNRILKREFVAANYLAIAETDRVSDTPGSNVPGLTGAKQITTGGKI